MATIEQRDDRLEVTIGWPVFNGCTAVFDKGAGTATIKGANFLFPFTRTVPIEDIAEVEYVRLTSAAFARIRLKSGGRIAMPSAGIEDAKEAVPIMQRFLGL